MPLQSTSGAASYDGFGGGVPVVPKYIEEYFSTFLYSGNAGTQTVTNGIDLSTKGGMVWIKSRSGAYPHSILDTVRGFNYSGTQTKRLDPSTTDSQADAAGNATQASPLTDGFSVTTSGGGAINFYNASGQTYTSWSWAKAPKFFDVVTYTGTGVSGRTVAHNLGSVPGCMIIKRLDATSNWPTYHRSLSSPQNNAVLLNLTNAAIGAGFWTANPTDTVFSLSGDADVNVNGGSYVAYLFAHNAGGFGLTGTDNVISCGSYTGTGATLNVNLGYEVQFVLIKPSTVTGNWTMMDNMRGMTQVGVDGTARLRPNTSEAESSLGGSYGAFPNATGFTVKSSPGVDDYNASGQTYIYIAIRRGPMKVPTSGTSVFSPIVATSGTGTTNFPVDMQILSDKGSTNAILNQQFVDRLRGVSSTTTAQGNYLLSSSTAAESSAYPNSSKLWSNTGFGIPLNYEGASSLYLSFRRAPSFFDEVCYTGTGSQLNVNHNLGSVPELIIVKNRNKSGGENWAVYNATLGAGFFLWLNTTDSVRSTYDAGRFPVAPTSSVFTVGSDPDNGGSFNYVAYLFATCAGVSKVGSYTGNGSSQTINCGFTGGARFVLIKKSSGTGDWMVADSARGIVSGNDPYLELNNTNAEVTGEDWLDTDSTGFVVNEVSGSNANTNGSTYIFLAIA